MKVEILVIGDEILLGQTQDTNSSWMAKKLSMMGLAVNYISVIPDEEKPILDSFQKAFHRSDVVLITGGLGPTNDDLTKGMIASFFDLPIVFRNDLLVQVKEIYEKRQLKFIETSREQAEFPEGAIPIRNENGTAPGIWVEKQGRYFVAMPGVPYEMRGMMENFVLPKLKSLQFGKKIMFRSLHTYGIKEAALYAQLDNRQEILNYARLAFLPAYNSVKLRLTVEVDSEEDGNRLLDKGEELIREKINDYIFAVGEEATMEEGLAQKLIKAGKKLVVAESCTGGLLAKKLTDYSGSSAWFERGFVTYSNEAKNELLNVPMKLIEEHGAVSPEVVEAMAEGALRNSKAHVALSITGIAGPTGGTDDKPVGLVYIGYADAGQVDHRRLVLDKNRKANRERSAAAAMMMLMDKMTPENADGEFMLI